MRRLRAVVNPQSEKTREPEPAELDVLGAPIRPILAPTKDEPLRAVRGAVVGALISGVFWILLGVALVLWL